VGHAERFNRAHRPNGHGNGRGQSLQMPANAVPIIGQPFAVTSIRLTVDVDLTCRCDPADPPSLHVNNFARTDCPRCHKSYVVNDIELANGQPPRLSLDIRTPVDQPTAEPTEKPVPA